MECSTNGLLLLLLLLLLLTHLMFQLPTKTGISRGWPVANGGAVMHYYWTSEPEIM